MYSTMGNPLCQKRLYLPVKDLGGPLYFQILIFSLQKNASTLPQKNGEYILYSKHEKSRKSVEYLNSFYEIF
jgi:hypothetical protein